MLSADQLWVIRSLYTVPLNSQRKAWPIELVLDRCQRYEEWDVNTHGWGPLRRLFLTPGLMSQSPDGEWCKLTDYGLALYHETEALQKEWDELPVIPLDDAEKEQIIINPGETFRGKIFITQLLKRAHAVIRIHDNYCCTEQLMWLYSVPASVDIRLLTSPRALKQDPTFESLYRAFAKERQAAEMRTTTDVHDRKIIIDDREAFQVGESLKDVGRKGTTIVRLKGVPEHIAQFNTLWIAATKL